jgi:Mitochondrial ATPase inhibitor, IATP
MEDEADAVLPSRSDSFTKREKANEDFYVRKKEMEK